MNKEQQKGLYLMLSGKNVFLTGSAGTGKSYLINEYIEEIKNKNELYNIGITSTTGISALLINGKTLHSWAGIGLGEGDLYKKVYNNKNALKRWKTVKTLIIDEISMLNPRLFDRLNDLGKKIRNNKYIPFGGIQIIAVGDFCQLPVVKGEGKFCFDTSTWKECDFEICNLTDIIRQNNKKFTEILQKIRLGNCDEESKELLKNRTGLYKNSTKNDDGIKPTILYSTNKNVNILNNNELDKLIKSGKSYKNYKINIDVKKTNLSLNSLNNLTEFLTKDNKNIKLSIDAQVMLTKNLDTEYGLVNGSRGIVYAFDNENNGMPIIKFINGIKKTIEPYKSSYIDHECNIIFHQLPLKLAWATTIHKSQGATLDYVVANLSNIFEYGQAYVALSRAKDLEHLYLTGINFSKINCHPNAKSFYENLNNT